MLNRLARAACLALLPLAIIVSTATADTASVTRSDGYQVTLTGPTTATVGHPVTFTATCGGSPCPYGEFRAFGGPLNRLGEGFGTGATGSYVARNPGFYSIRYRVGARCIGSARMSCPIDVWLGLTVTL